MSPWGGPGESGDCQRNLFDLLNGPGGGDVVGGGHGRR